MEFKFGTKFSEQQIDEFIDRLYNNFIINPKDEYIFDLSGIEWISNQGLLLLTAIWKYFIELNISFEIQFLKKGIPFEEIPKRVVLQIVQIWEVWGLWKIIPNKEYIKYFGFDSGAISTLKSIHGISFTRSEIFDSYGITPFIALENFTAYSDAEITQNLTEYHSLNEATIKILDEEKCSQPFVDELISELITRELYENFLDHYEKTFFNSKQDFAFFSIGLKGRINKDYYGNKITEEHLSNNFRTEEIQKLKPFFFDIANGKFKNQSYVSYSFLDFGDGICNTLREECSRFYGFEPKDSEIIKYAFKINTSRFPLFSNNSDDDSFMKSIPRGLFDIICLVQRYSGVIIARSCFGKVIYNFSNSTNPEEAFSEFGDNSKFFPGTFITIYLPSVESDKQFNYAAFKPLYNLPDYNVCRKKFVSLLKIVEESQDKPKFTKYQFFFMKLTKLLEEHNGDNTITYISFKNIEDRQLLRKLIFYLLVNYNINISNNIVIIHPPKKQLLDEIKFELQFLSASISLRIHPLPFIYYNKENALIDVNWLGVYDDHDIKTLNRLLFKDESIAKSEFHNPNRIIGHLNAFDEDGNLKSFFPDREIIELSYEFEELFIDVLEARSLILDNDCITEQTNNIYLCSGNYYQFKFIEIIQILNNQNLCKFISRTLFSALSKRLAEGIYSIGEIKFIAITSSSHKILKSLINQKLISKDSAIFLEHYHAHDLYDRLDKNSKNYGYILICDVMSTGKMVNRIDNILKSKNSQLNYTAVIVETIDPDFEFSKKFIRRYSKKAISLVKFPIKKYGRTDPIINKYIKEKKIIRINPFTNLPIVFSINETNIENVLIPKEEFLSYITDDHIKIGFLKNNNIIHPYYFITENIIKELGLSILKKTIIDKKIILPNGNLKIFYPKSSDIQFLDFAKFNLEVLKNMNVEYFELERFCTEDGWNFPHTTEHFRNIIQNNPILILDDGSCSGDSLMQMINEISFFKPKEIVTLSFIGRVYEHRREFLTLIDSLTKDKSLFKIRIYFLTHWHIPTYQLGENPNTVERNWLNEIIKLQNTPIRIKNIASKVLNELQPKNYDELKDYGFLPKDKGSGKPPKKDILRVRDEIGKVIGYRLYNESFDYFNEYMSMFSNPDPQIKKSRIRETELICAVIIYEPYLFDRLNKVTPDIVEKLKEFVNAIFYGNPDEDNKKIDIEKLYYKWNRRDFLHLHFTIQSESDLIEKLKNEYLIKLFDFLGKDGDSIYYIFYKFLKSFPLTANDLIVRDGSIYSRIIDTIIKRGNISTKALRETKIFRSFIATLPNKGDYYSQILNLSNNYRNLKDQVHHKKSAFANLDQLQVTIDVLKEEINKDEIDVFIKCWEVISDFIEPILSFSKTFPTFFIDNLNIVEGQKIDSIRSVHGKLTKIIYNLNSKTDFDELDELLEIIKRRLLSSSSILYKIFSNPTIHNLNQIIDVSLKDFIDDQQIKEELQNISPGIIIDFPEYYFSELILKEIVTNFRYAKLDSQNKIKLRIVETDKSVIIYLSNTVLNGINTGSGSGLMTIKDANKFPDNIFYYDSKVDGDIINQIITLKKSALWKE